MGLHLAWFKSRILREKCISVTVSRDETIYPFENSSFLENYEILPNTQMHKC